MRKILICLLLLILISPISASTIYETATYYQGETAPVPSPDSICSSVGTTPYASFGTSLYQYLLPSTTTHIHSFESGTADASLIHNEVIGAYATGYPLGTTVIPTSIGGHTTTDNYLTWMTGCGSNAYWTTTVYYKIKSGVRPPTKNVTFSISDSTNITNKLQGVIVTLSNGQSNTTDITGSTFIGVTPNSSYYTYSLTKSGYQVKTSESLGYLGEIGGIAYNTLTAGGISDYYITVSPAWIPSDGSQYLYGQIRKTGTSSTNLTDLKTISWQWRKWLPNGERGQSYSYQETTNSKNWLQFTKGSTGIYSGWNTDNTAFTNTKTAVLPNPLSLNPIGATGTILTTLYATDIYGNSYEYEVSNLIGDNTTAATNNVKVRNQDAYTGGALLFSTISLRDDINNVWYNVTAQTGEYDFSIPANKQVTIYSTASGYQNLLKNATTPVNGVIHQNMYASGYLGDVGKTQLIVYTRSAPTSTISSQSLSEVYTTINQINQTLIKSDYSSSIGNVIFSANISTVYTITASKTGYTTVSQTINTAAINPYEVYLYLTNNNVIQPTYTPTPYPTLTPITTLIGGGIKNTTSAVCGNVDGSTNIVDLFKSNIACWGVSDRFSQDLAFAALIIAFFAFIMSKYGKGLGAIVGAALGFVLSLAAGLIPVWIFFAFVIIAGLIFGLKLYGSDK